LPQSYDNSVAAAAAAATATAYDDVDGADLAAVSPGRTQDEVGGLSAAPLRVAAAAAAAHAASTPPKYTVLVEASKQFIRKGRQKLWRLKYCDIFSYIIFFSES
jgi:hypothetical protein